MNPAFKNELFWQAYEWLNYDGMKAKHFEQWKPLLAQDFTLVEGGIDYFIIPLPCGEEYELLIHFDLDHDACEKNLYLSHNETGERYLMGWWDLIRWHPYCLHPDELEMLMTYWEKQGGFWKENLAAAFMLLQGFLGLENKQQQQAMVQRKRQALHDLGFGDVGEVGIAYRDDYYWKESELGREYTSDTYSCYSMRNADHIHTEVSDEDKHESRFPFEDWQEIMLEIAEKI